MPDINGIPYVESSDLVSGWPTVSQSVAQEVSDQLASKLDLAGGKVLQIVRATDGTDRTTTSTSFVDASISVTITPEKNDSAVIIIWTCVVSSPTSNPLRFIVADSSNNQIGGQQGFSGYSGAGYTEMYHTVIAYATPATTSATTYKGRFRVTSGSTGALVNSASTAQLFAIEVSA